MRIGIVNGLALAADVDAQQQPDERRHDRCRDSQLHLTGDVIGELDFRAPAGRLGADAIWRKRVHLRAGYAFDASDGSGPAVGLGIDTGSLVFDIARIFDGFSADAGQAPTYFSLRYLF